MQELRFVAVSEDGSYAVLAVPGRSGRFILSIDERLRAVAAGQTTRLAQYEIEVESPLRPKEIQARIRAGETAEEIADAAGIPVERVRWFEGPVLAERAYIADQAQAASVRRSGDSGGPGSRLGDIVPERLTASGGTPEDGQWDSRKRGDGHWQVTLTFPSGGRLHTAEWVFDPRRRHVMPDDDNAARLSLPESELPPEPVALPGEATVTPLAPRLGAAAGMGGGGFAGGGSGVGVRSFRPERSVIPDRSLGGDRSLADRPTASSAVASASAAAGPASGSERPGMPERTGLAHSPAATPVLPRPSYHDHTDFRDAAPEPPAYREPAAHREPAAEQAGAHRASSSASASAAAGVGATAAEEIVPVTAPSYVFDEPAPSAAPAAPAAPDDRDRARAAHPRQVVFEEPEPAFLDEQLELASSAPAASAPSASEHVAPASAPASANAVASERAESAPAQPAQARREAAAAPAAPAAVQHATQVGAAAASESRQPAAAASADVTHSELVTSLRPEPAVDVRAQPADQAAGAQEAMARVASAAKAAGAPAPAPASPAHTAAPPAAAEPGVVAASASAPPQPADADKGTTSAQAEVAEPTPAAPAAVAAAGPSPRAKSSATGGSASASESAPAASTEPVSATTATPTAAKAPAVPAAAAAQPEPVAAAKPSPEPEPKPAAAPAEKSESAEDQSTPQRPAAKKNAKGRRSSVPSWDEIMLGSARQRD